ncbi:MAG: haloacid dehalogenase type II [Nocardioides sp.]
MTIKVIAFDVNETLLDLSSLDDEFAARLGSAALRPQWFAQMLQLSFVGGLTGQYVDFRTAQLAAFEMLAERQGVALDPGAAEAVVDRMSSLAPHPEVGAALKRLARTPLRLVALTNSTEVVARAQVENAGLADYFEDVLSADSVRALKPAAAAYQHVASTCGVGIDEIRLVAAHPWDVSGALAAGCRAAFMGRSGVVPSPLGPRPDIVGADLDEIVDQIIARDVDAVR